MGLNFITFSIFFAIVSISEMNNSLTGSFYRPDGYFSSAEMEKFNDPKYLDQVLADASKLDDQLQMISKIFGDPSEGLKAKTCAKGKGISIDLVVEVHGTDSAENAEKLLLNRALSGKTIVYLEGETKSRSGNVGITRTLARHGLPTASTENIRPLDTNKTLSSYWRKSILIEDIGGPHKESHKRLNLLNSRRKKALSKPQQLAFLELLLRHDVMLDALGKASKDSTLHTEERNYAHTLYNRVTSLRQQSAIKNGGSLDGHASTAISTLGFFNLLEKMAIRTGSKFGGLLRCHKDERIAVSVFDRMSICSQYYKAHEGLTRRDAEFSKEISLGVCEAARTPVDSPKSISVIIGAAHGVGLKRNLEKIFGKDVPIRIVRADKIGRSSREAPRVHQRITW